MRCRLSSTQISSLPQLRTVRGAQREVHKDVHECVSISEREPHALAGGSGECSGFHNISIDERGPSTSLAQWLDSLQQLNEK